MAAARTGSLGYVVLAGGLAVAVSGLLWGVLDSRFLATLIGTQAWQQPPDQVAALAREYVLKSWDYLLLFVLVRVGLDALIASRLQGSSSAILRGTAVLLFAHLLLIMWALLVPAVTADYYALAQGYEQVEQAGFLRAVELGYEWGVAYAPALLLVGADVWYLSAPIRNDMLRRGV